MENKTPWINAGKQDSWVPQVPINYREICQVAWNINKWGLRTCSFDTWKNPKTYLTSYNFAIVNDRSSRQQDSHLGGSDDSVR